MPAFVPSPAAPSLQQRTRPGLLSLSSLSSISSARRLRSPAPAAFAAASSSSFSSSSASRMRVRASADGPADLLVIGAGELGRRVAEQWVGLDAGARVVCETATPRRHDALRAAGMEAALAGAGGTGRRVVFCVPPSGAAVPSADSSTFPYADAVAAAAARVAPGGRFVFTSSGSVHGGAALHIDEATPVAAPDDSLSAALKAAATAAAAGSDSGRVRVPPLARAVRLACAERCALDGAARGLVVRLSGLYTATRGAHSFWLGADESGAARVVRGDPDGELNLIHYDDAAAAVVAALALGDDVVDALAAAGTRCLLAAAARMISRRDVIQAALGHPLFAGGSMPAFEFDPPPPQGQAQQSRTYDSTWTRATTGWTPQWEGFDDFMREDAEAARTAGGGRVATSEAG